MCWKKMMDFPVSQGAALGNPGCQQRIPAHGHQSSPSVGMGQGEAVRHLKTAYVQ